MDFNEAKLLALTRSFLSVYMCFPNTSKPITQVADSLDAKYGGVGVSPWQIFGFADAPSLCMACCDTSTTAYNFFRECRPWQARFQYILKGKRVSDRIRKFRESDQVDLNNDGVVDEEDIENFAEFLEDPFHDDKDIQYDINPNITNLVIVGGVEVRNGRVGRVNTAPQQLLEAIVMDHLVAQKACVGIASMHAVGGYMGLVQVSDWLNMQVPVLMLDTRKRKTYENKYPDEHVKDRQDKEMSPEQLEKEQQAAAERANQRVDVLFKIFNEMKISDCKLEQDLREQNTGKVDIFELNRLAHFHTTLLPQAKSVGDSKLLIFEAIQEQADAALTFNDDEPARRFRELINEVTEFLIEREFKAYWDLKPDEEIEELKTKNHITSWKQLYKTEIVDARAAIYCVLTHSLTFSSHVTDLSTLEYLLNYRMLDRDSLPDSNSFESLIILRSAWDVVDIAHYVLRGYKLSAKVLYFLVVIFAVVHPSVVVYQIQIDAAVSLTLVDGSAMTGSQFIIFIVSTITAFITAIMAFFSPLRRWQQIRDAGDSMTSAIWQYRTRTGAYACSRAGDSIAANATLREQVLECRQKILGGADMAETSFYKQYPASIFIHGQRAELVSSSLKGGKIAPQDGDEDEELLSLDLEIPETRHQVNFCKSQLATQFTA